MKKGKFIILGIIILMSTHVVAQRITHKNIVDYFQLVPELDGFTIKKDQTGKYYVYEPDMRESVVNSIVDITNGYVSIDYVSTGGEALRLSIALFKKANGEYIMAYSEYDMEGYALQGSSPLKFYEWKGVGLQQIDFGTIPDITLKNFAKVGSTCDWQELDSIIGLQYVLPRTGTNLIVQLPQSMFESDLSSLDDKRGRNLNCLKDNMIKQEMSFKWNKDRGIFETQ